MMEQVPESSPDQGDRTPAIQRGVLGRTLREARERLGLSIADVANQIKFAPRQIDALEAEDFMRLQGATFLRGFVRSYAKILHLDAQPLLEQLPLDKPVQPQLKPASVDMPFPSLWSTRQQNLIWSGAALLVAALVVIFGLWHSSSPRSISEFNQAQSKAAPVEAQVSLSAELSSSADLTSQDDRASTFPSTSPKSTTLQTGKPAPVDELLLMLTPEKSSDMAAAKSSDSANAKTVPTAPQFGLPETRSPEAAPKIQTAKPKPVKSETDTTMPISSLRLVFGKESWTEIKDRDGKILSSQINPPGSELRVEGHPPFTMLMGHGLSVRLYQDDEEVDLKPYINKYSEVAHLTLE